MVEALSGKAAIAGIGATEFSKASGRSELQLSVEAVRHALTDCGLTPADVDGLVTFTMDTSSEIAVARELGIPELRFFSRINYGGGAACATVQPAAIGAPSLRPGLPIGKFQGAKAATGPTGYFITIERWPVGRTSTRP